MPLRLVPLHELRSKYKATHAAYLSSVEALKQASVGGRPSQDLLDSAAKALAKLTEARARLLAAVRGGSTGE